ncbi:glycoside hydrolase family 2 TIM barrel-domain containing protein [Frondihabitans cladoniiphilus]|uniref:Beta-galactosidase n=1 Tax=Frondihabitans cladoniiphilus TaxID=715785 RepID=A0ABP8W9G2_9MICO
MTLVSPRSSAPAEDAPAEDASATADADPTSSYLTDTGPGSGARTAARSWLHTDAPTLSLDGQWRFRLLPAAPGTLGGRGVLPEGETTEGVAAIDYDDSSWGELPVPAHWVLEGDGAYGRPIYTNVQFPFATDAPNVPDENPTGDYRRSFEVPSDWPASPAAFLLRFDGVESRYRVWLNGSLVGVGVGSRLAQEFDVTALVRPGANLLVVRVHQWSASSYVEDQDQWWLPGIFRSVSLQARPVGGLEDVWLDASFDPETGGGCVTSEVRASPDSYPVTVRIADLGVEVTWQSPTDVAPIEVPGVEPWSAETPRLYAATVSSAEGAETVALRLGFRTVRIVGDRFEVNGRRVVFHGVNRHETHPDRGRVFDEAWARDDLARMKRFNVNAIRTSHYPPHPRLLDLADELGFWVVLECDLETHGFEHRHQRSPWEGNPSDDPAWRDAYVDRIERTVERDKNHPSIVMWSLGNESGTGANLAAMSAWVHARDRSRPVHYEGDYTGAYTDVYSRMYSSVPETESIGRDPGLATGTGELLLGCSATESIRQRSKPFLLCEYVHAMGNGPGAIDQYEDLVDRYPRLHGGFVWEWRDHGLRSTTADGRDFFAYGGDFDEVVHDGNFVMDGLVLSDDTPTPGLHEYAAVVAPVRFGFSGSVSGSGSGSASVSVDNRRHSADTSDLAFEWDVSHDGIVVDSGRLDVPVVAAGSSTPVPLPSTTVSDSAETWLTVRAVLASPTAWAPAGHIVATAQLDRTPAAVRTRLSTPPRPASSVLPSAAPAASIAPDGLLELGPATFRDGRLVALAGRPVDGPRLELWRAPTDNDEGDMSGSYDLGDPWANLGHGVLAPSHAERWRTAGLDRLVGRVTSVSQTERGMRILTRWSAADLRESVDVDEHWELIDGELWLRADLTPSAHWDLVWPRVGLRFDLPQEVTEASWFGTGPLESYPDSRRASHVGRFSSAVDDLVFPYARPQESGHRSDLRSLTVSVGDQPWLTIDATRDARGRLPGFTLARHTAQQTARAQHPHELPPSTGAYLYLDAAQNGLGSRACGPDVWPEFLLRPEARSIVVRVSGA